MSTTTKLAIVEELSAINKAYDTSITIVEGLTHKQKDVVRMIEFYSNSKYLNGQKDELGREKPFYNTGNAMVDVENAAKDIDTKDIQATSDDGQHYTESFLMSKDIYEWTKTANFAKTLNDMIEAHSRYGSLLVKKVIKREDGERKLSIEIPEWKNVITDQVDIINGAIVEVHYMLPSEILVMSEWENKEEAIKLGIKENEKNFNSKRIKVYEIRGEFPKAFIKELNKKKITEKDKTKFSYQLYYLAGEIGGSLIPLYWEDDTEKVYKYLPRKKKSGRDFGVGVIEEGEEAQVWTNDAILKQHRAMEYTTKVIGQTASKRLKGRNIMTEVDDGQILEHEDGKPITRVDLLPSGGLNQYQTLIAQWYSQAEKTSSAYPAQRGETPPSGQAFRLQALVLNQSNSVFVKLQEELGIFLTEIFNDWIMPFLAEQMNQEHILAHDFSPEELQEIDRNFAIAEANEKVKKMILSGKIVSAEDYQRAIEEATNQIKKTKSRRFIQLVKDYYRKAKLKITVNITGEQKNKAATMESLFNILTLYAQNPALVQDPVLSQIFMKIVELSGAGISPVSLMGAIQEQAKTASGSAITNNQPSSAPVAAMPTPAELSLAANPNAAIA